MFGKSVSASATIVADEGYKFVDKDGRKTLQHEKYIVEVHPADEPAFRAEVTAWVSWPDLPKVGDTVQVTYKARSHDVELDIHGDPRFDWKLLEAQRDADAAATRERLLKEPPSSGAPPSTGDGSGETAADQEVAALMDELERRKAPPGEPDERQRT